MSVWEHLDDALDPGLLRPRLAGDIEVVPFRTRWGTGYTMVKNPRGPAYYRLTEDEGRLLGLMDGQRTVREIVVEGFRDSGSFDLSAVTDLVDLLYESGFLERRWVDAYAAVRERLRPRRPRSVARLRRIAKTQTIHFPRAHALTDLGYRLGGRLVFTRPAQVVFLLLLFGGVAAFVADVRSGRFEVGAGSLAIGLGLLFVFDMIATLIHEAGHALAIRHAGRRIDSAGFQLYLGHPAFFIDSSDVLMAPPRDRIRNAWYGPYSGLVIAGLCSLLILAWPGLPIADVLYQLAVLTYLTVLLNLIPFLELDGYWILMDVLETTDLRPRSLAFLRYELPRRVAERQRLTRHEWALTGFGILGAIFTVVALWTSYWFWAPIFERLVLALWNSGWVSRALLLVLGAFVLGPLVIGVLRLLRAFWGRLRFAGRRLRFLAQTGWRREAGELIAGLPLLQALPMEALNELAGRVQLRRYTKGRAVVRRGERADAFYVVRSGRLAVVDETTGGDGEVLRLLSRGEAFGELALLERRPRTATVRAEETSEVFRVDKGTFDRLLAESVSAPELVPSFWALEEIWALPAFRHLEADEAAAVAEAGAWVQLGPGETVVEQGEPGEDFFVVSSGRLEVERDGAVVGALAAGDHFGEIALLEGVPRTATVRTLTPARVFRLGREAFDRLVAAAFDRGTLHPPHDRERFTEKKG